MKKIFTLLLLTIALASADVTVGLAQKPQTEINYVKQKGETIKFALTSSRPFVFGNNRYVLYVAGKEFMKYDQSKVNGKGLLVFHIPVSDFKNLRESAPIYLSYGRVDTQSEDMDEAAKSRWCWYLGKFSQSLLTK